ncbi:hypothetical protein [Xenorhabdus santafensis]|nr:hypothetical protein [Xenorhabdus sp. 12]
MKNVFVLVILGLVMFSAAISLYLYDAEIGQWLEQLAQAFA